MTTKASKRIVETFAIDPSRGFVALAIGLRKPGYRIISIIRKEAVAKVTFEKV